ncbi:hypothetical protein Q7P36_002746 [Cladosporium allicinum]
MADNNDNKIKSIAVVGASGNIGTSILNALLSSNNFSLVKILTRAESTASFSNQSKTPILVQKGSYTNPSFLASAFQGIDAVVFALNFMAMGVQGQMIEAAARAGVKWILPTEYAGDGLNEGMVEAVPLFHPKREARRQIEELSKEKECEGVKWIGVATGPWVEASIQRSLFTLNPHSRTATLYPDAGHFNTTTLPHAGLAISNLLSLPISNPSNPRASLSYYANNFLYTSSFHTTQQRIFESLQRATGTKEGDWEVERQKTIEEWEKTCREGMAKGDMMSGAGLTFAYYMGEGRGGDVEGEAKEDREVLGLEGVEEDLDEVIKRAVEGGEPKALEFGK